MKKIHNKLLLLFFTSILLFITVKAYRNQALSFHFVDEEDNIVLGKYLLENEKLYSDLFSHHQPLAYIFSAGVQKISQPNNLFMLIKRHREALIVWSIGWVLLLVWRFGKPLAVFAAIFEPIKLFLLGNLFLAESLVVYPFVYLIAWLFLPQGEISKMEVLFLGFCLSLSFLLFSPLWPVLLLLAVLVWQKLSKHNFGRFEILGLLGGVVLPIIPVLLFISVPDYFFDAFYVNFKYYIPAVSKESWIITALKAFASPILALISFSNTATSQVIKFLSVLLIFNAILLVKEGNLKLVLLISVILGLSNIRYVPPGQQEYSGFHLLPWFGALIVVTTISSTMIWKKGIEIRSFITIGIFMLIGMTVFNESKATLFKPRDQALDFYINYSRQENFGRAIQIMKSDNETLFVVPDEWLVYWQADIKHASKMVNYYAWMSEVPEIKNPLHQIFTQNPPTFFYCDRCQFGYFGLEQFFPEYQKLKQDGKDTSLWVLKEKISKLTMEQVKLLSYYRFTTD